MPKTEQTGAGPVEVFTPEEASELLEKGEAVLIDVRTPAEYAFERIRGALLVPLSDVEPSMLPSQEGKRLIFHCGSGVRSRVAAEKILQAGYGPVAHMENGLMGWKRASLPFIATDPMTGAPRDVVAR